MRIKMCLLFFTLFFLLDTSIPYVHGDVIVPYIAAKSMETDDYIIATINVKHEAFGAKGDGKTDDTQAIQKALNKAAEMGGGIVFIPSGLYKINGNLIVPGTVILRGEWKNPLNGGAGKGTILMAFADKGIENGKPFISMNVSSCIMDLSIWYPEQNFDDIKPYPWTIGFIDVSVTAKNITFYNSYQGIHTALINGSAQHVKNIYGTVLKQGIVMDKNLEVSDFVNIYFGNDIWANSSLPGSPTKNGDKKKLRDYTSQHATGITLARNDDVFLYEINVNRDDFNTGVHIIKNDDPAPFGGGTYGHIIKLNNSSTKIEATSQWTTLSISDDIGGTEKFRHEFAPEKRPNSDNFFNVKNAPFNAKGDGRTDDFKAIQKALDAAGESGGGTVFLPPGQYKVTGELFVPSGVELRGTFEEIHHVMDKPSSELCAYSGKGDKDGEAFITLCANSGIHGVTISYPEQIMGNDYVPYPWTIKGNGDYVWVEYVTIINGYDLINFYDNRCNNFVVKGVWATALNKGIAIGGGSINGYMEYNFITYAIWMETSRKSGSIEANNLRSYCAKNSIAFIFGDCTGINALSNFAFMVKEGFVFQQQNNSYCKNSTFFRVGLDQPNVSTNIIFKAADLINIIGLSTANHRYYLYTDETFNGTVNIYGINQWGGGLNLLKYGQINIFRCGQGLFNGSYENIVYGKDIQSSSNRWGGFRAEDSIDGLRHTAWVSDDKEGPHWIMVNLNGDFFISGWKVLHAGFNGDNPKYNTNQFKLQVSLNGDEWSDIDMVSENKESITDRKLKKYARARFVRLFITNPVQNEAEDKAARINEFMVFGKPYDKSVALQYSNVSDNDNGKVASESVIYSLIAVGAMLITIFFIGKRIFQKVKERQ